MAILYYPIFLVWISLSLTMAITTGVKIQEELNNIPLADDDPQGKMEFLSVFL